MEVNVTAAKYHLKYTNDTEMKRSRKKKDPLGFIFTDHQPSQTKDWVHFLTQEYTHALGPSNLNWFEEATERNKFLQLQKNPQHGSTLLKRPVAPPQHDEQPMLVSIDVVSLSSFGQPLFRKSMRSACRNDIQGSILSPSTPGFCAKTPSQEGRLFRLPSNDELATPLAMLLVDSNKKPFHDKMITPMQDPKTSLDLTMMKSLGVDPNQTGVSWTSSLATPPVNGHSGKVTNLCAPGSDLREELCSKLHGTAARVLFSPGCVTDSDHPDDVDAQVLNDTEVDQELVSSPISNGNKFHLLHMESHPSVAVTVKDEMKVENVSKVNILKHSFDTASRLKSENVQMTVNSEYADSCSETNPRFSQGCLPLSQLNSQRNSSQRNSSQKRSRSVAGQLYETPRSTVTVRSTSQTEQHLAEDEIFSTPKNVCDHKSKLDSEGSDSVGDILSLFVGSARRSAPKRLKVKQVTGNVNLFPLSPLFPSQKQRKIDQEMHHCSQASPSARKSTIEHKSEIFNAFICSRHDGNSDLHLKEHIDMVQMEQLNPEQKQNPVPESKPGLAGRDTTNLSMIPQDIKVPFMEDVREQPVVAEHESMISDALSPALKKPDLFSQMSPDSVSAMCSVAEKTEISQCCQSPDLMSQFSPVITDLGNSCKQSVSASCDQSHVTNPGQNHASVLCVRDMANKELQFTQLPPELIDDAYEQVREVNQKDNVLNGEQAIFIPSNDHANSHDSSRQVVGNFAVSHKTMSDKNHSPVQTENSKLCLNLTPKNHSIIVKESTQIPKPWSPMILKAISTSASPTTLKPITTAASPVTFEPGSTSASPIFKPLLKQTSLANISKPMSKLKPKPKRFAYPTSSQISKTCPKKVFQLRDETESATLAEPHDTNELTKAAGRQAADRQAAGPYYESSSILENAVPEPARRLPRKRKSTGFTTLTVYSEKVPQEHPTIVPYSDKSSVLSCANKSSMPDVKPEPVYPCVPRTGMLKRQSLEDDNETHVHKWSRITKPLRCLPDIDLVEDSIGFASASGKKVKIFDTAKSNVLELLQEIDAENINVSKSVLSQAPHSNTPETSPGIVTKSDQIEAENLLSEYGNELLHDTQFTQAELRCLSEDSDRENVKSEDDAAHFEDCYFESKSAEKIDIKDVTMKPVAERGETKGMKLMGFQCASGKTIDISSAAQEKARQWVEVACSDDGIPANIEKKDEIISTEKLNVNDVLNLGFKNASGKVLAVKQDDLTRYQKWLDDDLDDKVVLLPLKHESSLYEEEINTNLRCSKNANEVTAPDRNLVNQVFQGFKSASGKGLKVSNATIAKYSSWLDDDDLSSKIINTSLSSSSINTSTIASVPSIKYNHESNKAVSDEQVNLKEYIHKENDCCGSQTTDKYSHSANKPSDIMDTDWSKVPKGFRPFKAPKMMKQMKQESCVSTTTTIIKDEDKNIAKKMNLNNNLKGSAVKSLVEASAREIPKEKCGIFSPDKDLTVTQMKDVSKGLVDFLEHDASFSQDDFTEMHNIDKKMSDHNDDDNLGNEAVLKFCGFQTTAGRTVSVSLNAQRQLECDGQEPPRKAHIIQNCAQHEAMPQSTMTITGCYSPAVNKVNNSDNKMKEVKRFVDDVGSLGMVKGGISHNSVLGRTVDHKYSIQDVFLLNEKSLANSSNSVVQRIQNLFQNNADQNSFLSLDSPKAKTSGLNLNILLRTECSFHKQSYVSPSPVKCREVPSGYTPKLDPSSSSKLYSDPRTSKKLVPRSLYGGLISATGAHVTVSAADQTQTLLAGDNLEVHEATGFNNCEQFLSNCDVLSSMSPNRMGQVSGQDSQRGNSEHTVPHPPLETFNQHGVVANQFMAQSLPGFSTAGCRPLSGTTAALNEIKLLCDSVNAKSNFVKDDNVENNKKPEEMHGSHLTKFAAFKTAGVNSVSVSASAVEKVKVLMASDKIKSGTGRLGTLTRIYEDAQVENNNIAGANKTSETMSGTGSCHLADYSFKDKNLDIHAFSGFQSASGKTIHFSEENLSAARKLLNESLKYDSDHSRSINDRVDHSHTAKEAESTCAMAKNEMDIISNVGVILNGKKKTENITGFLTARGNKIQISSDAVDAARMILDDSNESRLGSSHVVSSRVVQNNFYGTNLSDFVANQETQKFSGFQTARGQIGNISSESLHVAENIWDNFNSKEAIDSLMANPRHEPFGGFHTATGKAVPVSANSLAAAKDILNDGKNKFPVVDMASDDLSIFAGSHTTAGSKVSVSEDVLMAAKKLIDDDDYEKENLDSRIEPISNFNGFQTAKGSRVSISSSALQAAKTLLYDSGNEKHPIPDPVETNLRDVMDDNLQKEGHGQTIIEEINAAEVTKTFPGFSGFQTAKGNAVSVSAEASAIKTLLDDDHTGLKGSTIEPMPTPKFCGFQTAKGSKVYVCNDSLAAARNLFINESGKTETSMGFKDHQSTPKAERVNSSTDSTYAGKDILANSNKKSTAPQMVFKGFQTAKGGKFDVSIDSLNATKTLLDSEADSGFPKMTFNCFQTAKGGKVNVSVESLNAAKNLLTGSGDNKDPPKPSFEGLQSGKNGNGEVSSRTRLDEGTKHNADVAMLKLEINLPQQSDTTNINKIKLPTIPVFRIDQRAINIQARVPSQQAPEINQNLSFSQETMESTKALLADGDFDEETWEPAKPWMKPVAIGPEEYLRDRSPIEHTGCPKSVTTSPEQDVSDISSDHEKSSAGIYRWIGPKQYKKFNVPHKCKDDRTGFTPPVRPIRKHSKVEESIPTPIVSTTEKSSFHIPYKKKSFPEPSDSEYRFLPSNSERNDVIKFQPPVQKSLKSDFSIQSNSKSEFNKPQSKSILSDNIKEINLDTAPSSKDCADNSIPNSEMDTPDTVCTLSNDVKKSRLKAKVTQAQDIQQKRKSGNTRPVAGQLFTNKNSDGKAMTLKETFEGYRPRSYTKQQLYSFGVKARTLTIQASNAEDFSFLVSDYYGMEAMRHWDGAWAGDGGFVVFSDVGTIGKEEICNSLLAMPGVEPKLVDRDWVYNHYRWIIWKLAAMEIGLPHRFAGRLLTPDQVLLQIKYRYDREVDHSQRSALKKIYEQDDSPQKLMVLCVCGILSTSSTESCGLSTISPGAKHENRTTGAVIALTDGWYSIKAVLDKPLTKLLKQSRIAVGDKLCICGADFVTQHEACPPLQAPGDVMLKLNINGTRRARWHVKLGYCSNPQPPSLSLSSLHPDGGMVSCVDVLVTRLYPMQYLEKLPDGSSIWRSSRGEERTAERFTKGQQQKLEKLYQTAEEQIRKDTLETEYGGKRSRKHWKASELSKLQDGADLYDAITQSVDPSSIEMMLGDSQQMALSCYRQQRHDQLQAQITSEIQKKVAEAQTQPLSRRVVPTLKVRLAGCATADVDASTSAILTVWRPPEDITSFLVEGNRLKIHNLTAGSYRGSGVSNISLSTGRTTRYQTMDVDDNFRDLVYEPREIVLSSELQVGQHTPYGEFDTVGLVIRVSDISTFDRQGGSEGSVQTLYLADANYSIIAVKLWGGLMAHYLEDIVHEGVWLSCSNLQWKPDRGSPWPGAVASDMTHFSSKPRDNHLQVALKHLQEKIKDVKLYVANMKMNLSETFVAKQQMLHTRRHSLDVGLPAKQSDFDKKFTPQLETSSNARVSSINRNITCKATFKAQRNISEKLTLNDDEISENSSRKNDSTTHNQLPQCTKIATTDAPRDQDILDYMKSTELNVPENPALARQKALQEWKAIKLELHGLSPDVCPLNSPIPRNVSKAFKPPSLNNGTPVTTRRTLGSTSGVMHRTPLGQKTNMFVEINSSGRKSDVNVPVNDSKCIVSSCDDSTVNEVFKKSDENVPSNESLHGIDSVKMVHDSQTDGVNSEITDLSLSTENIASTEQLNGVGTKKRKAMECLESSSTGGSQKRRKSLRLNRS